MLKLENQQIKGQNVLDKRVIIVIKELKNSWINVKKLNFRSRWSRWCPLLVMVSVLRSNFRVSSKILSAQCIIYCLREMISSAVDGRRRWDSISHTFAVLMHQVTERVLGRELSMERGRKSWRTEAEVSCWNHPAMCSLAACLQSDWVHLLSHVAARSRNCEAISPRTRFPIRCSPLCSLFAPLPLTDLFESHFCLTWVVYNYNNIHIYSCMFVKEK